MRRETAVGQEVAVRGEGEEPDFRRMVESIPHLVWQANPLGALLSLRDLAGVLPLALVSFWWSLATMVYPSSWSFYAIAAFGWSTGMVGFSFACVGALMTLSQMFVVGRVVAAIGERRAAALGIAAATFMFCCYALLRDGRLVFLVFLLMPLQSLVMPALGAMSSRRHSRAYVCSCWSCTSKARKPTTLRAGLTNSMLELM